MLNLEKTVGIFYEVIAKNGKKNYLFGTMHVSDKDVTILPLEVVKAKVEADYCVFEADITEQSVISALRMELYKKWFDDNIEYRRESYEVYLQKAVAFLSKKYAAYYSTDQLDWISPILLSTTSLLVENTSVPVANNNPVLDAMLISSAKEDGKSIHFLETHEEQLKCVNGLNFTLPEHLEFFDFCINYIQDSKKSLPSKKKLKEAYLAEDTKLIQQLLNPIVADNAPEVIQKYYKAFLTDRDARMATQILGWLEKGNAFIAIGAVHVDPIINKLLLEGCQIKPIQLTKRVCLAEYSYPSICLFGFFNGGISPDTKQPQPQPRSASIRPQLADLD